MSKRVEDKELPGRTFGSEEAEEYLVAEDEIELRREQVERAWMENRKHRVAMKF
jgi:hypothetical protein